MCSGSTRGECRLPQISAGKPTWEFGAKCTWEQISKSHRCGLALPTSRVDKKGISGTVATQCSPVQQGRSSFSHHRGTLIPPSLHTQAPSYQKTLVILEIATSQGKSCLQNLSLQHKTLLGSFHFLLHIYLKCQSGGPLVELARSQKKSTAFLRWIPPFHLAGNPKEGITFPYTYQPAWEMRNCSPFIR